MKEAIIMDIDDTICQSASLKDHREEVMKNDYRWFNKQILTFKPEKYAIVLLNNLSRIYTIIFITARDEICRKKTEYWLDDNFSFKPYHPYKLLMRATGDHREDTIVKFELYNKHVINKYNVIFAVDDQKDILKMWRDKLGIPTLKAKLK